MAPPEIQGQIDIGGGGDAEENADPSGGEDNNELDIDEWLSTGVSVQFLSFSFNRLEVSCL